MPSGPGSSTRRTAAASEPLAWVGYLNLPLAGVGLLAADPQSWPLYLSMLALLTCLWPFCIQLREGVEVYFPVTWASTAATYILGLPALFIIWTSATLGYLLIGLLDRAGLVEAKGLAARSLRRPAPDQFRPASNVQGLLRQFVYLSAHLVRVGVMAAARAAAPAISFLPVVAAGEAAAALWTRIIPLPERASPRAMRARFAATLGHDILVATDLAHVGIVIFLLMSYERAGTAGFVAASVSTTLLHVILKRQNDLRIQSDQQREALMAMTHELERRQRLAVIGQTASTVFHQIARHHGSIGIFAHLLTRGAAADATDWARTVREHAQRILGSVEEANRVMDELLRFGQDRALNLYPQPLRELVEECVSDCQPRAAASGVTVAVAGDADATIVLDKYKIKQALGNLIDNALDASPAGAAVEVVPEASGALVRISVRDHGPGVPEEIRAQLFTPFCTAKPEGVGLGLALAKELVEAHGGSIEWRPAAPGTVFVLTLPLEPPRATRDP